MTKHYRYYSESGDRQAWENVAANPRQYCWPLISLFTDTSTCSKIDLFVFFVSKDNLLDFTSLQLMLSAI